MFKSFSAERFRGFERLELNDLGRVNLFTGANNIGKTAVLEAMFLHLTPTQLEFVSGFPHRGQGRGSTRGLPLGLRYVKEWRSLFFDLDVRRPVSLRSIFSDGRRPSSTLTVHRADWRQLELFDVGRTAFDDENAMSSAPESYELRCVFSDGTGGRGEAIARTAFDDDNGRAERISVRVTPPFRPAFPAASLLGTGRQSRATLARKLSASLDRGVGDDVVATLKLLDDRIEELVIRVEERYPAVYVSLGLGRPVPLRLVGEGVTRVLEIVLAIYNDYGGVVMVDEVENGLHYSVLPDVWRAIGRAAESADVQVMATTHSYECVRAAHLAAADAATYDLRVHRLERDRNGKVFVIGYDRESLDTSLDLEWEIR